MSDIISLAAYREPVTYTIDVTHHWDGKIEISVSGIMDDPRSKREAAKALLEAAAIADRATAA